MTTFATVLRGLRSRALLSLASLAMMVLALAGVVLGPVFQQASVDSYTLTRVDAAPEPLTALSWSAYVAGPQSEVGSADLDTLVGSAVEQVDRLRPAVYAPPEVLLFSDEVVRPADGALVRYLARDDVCATLEVEGRCPERPGEVLLNREDLRGLAIGDAVDAPELGNPVVVGVYETPAGTGDWLYPALLASRPATAAPNAQPYRPAPYVVTPEVLSGLRPRLWDVQLESRLVVPDRMGDRAFDDLVADIEAVRSATYPVEGGQLDGTSTVNALGAVLVDVRGQREAARNALAPAVLSLVLVALAMILRLQVAAVAARAPEQALAALRGLGRRRSWVLGLSEPWLLVLASVPLGLLAGYAGATALARAWLRPGIGLAVPTASVVGAVLVTLALAAVSAAAVAQGMREPIGARLAGVHRPRPSSRLVVTAELVVVLLALVLPLTRVGADPDGLGLADLLLPVAAAVAAGLVTTRVVTALATRWTARGAQRPLSVFVAARAVARRAQGTLVVLPVTAAISLAVFAVGVDSVAAAWRASVAATAAPADDVYESPLTLDETLQLTRDVDPEGRYAMAAAQVSIPSVGSVAVLDSGRLGRVGAWPAQWLGGRTGVEAADLLGPSAPVLRLAGASTVTGLEVDGAPLSPGLADGGWTGAGDGAVVVPPDETLLPVAASVPLPVLVGVEGSGLLAGDGSSLETASETLDVTVAGTAESLPFVGPAGLLADLPTFLLTSDPPPPLVQPSVLVRDDAPAAVVDPLRAAGLVRVGGLADERRALDDSAYALALRLYLVVGAVLLLMALGGLVVSNAVQVPARRRDAASLRVVGVPRRTVVLASVWESVVVLGAAAVAGVLAGVGALAVLLPSLDLGVTDAATVPRVLADPDVGRLVLLASAVGVVLLAVATVTAVLVVRRARAASLRETAR